MKQRIISFLRHPLVSGSTIVMIGFMAASLINYFFNLAIARMLSSTDYGIFASLIAMFNILSVFSYTIITVFTKFSASYVGREKKELIGPLFLKGNIWVGGLSFLLCGLIILFASKIALFLNIKDVFLINITIISLFFSLMSSISLGVLQGLLRFVYISFFYSSTSLVKLILGIIFVLSGGRVFGAVSAFFLSNFSSFIIGAIPLINFLKIGKMRNLHLPNLHKELSLYAMPVFLSNIGITSMISVDIILIKHFFDPLTAGHYAALSLMGRSIFYVVSPIASVLFPLIAQKKERKEKLLNTLLLSLLLVGLPSLILSLIYFMFPNIILNIFFPAKEYIRLASYLGPFSVFVLFYSLIYILNSFYLSIGKGKVFFLTTGASLLEVLYIMFFHNNIDQIILGLISISFLLLLSLLLYYRNATKTS